MDLTSEIFATILSPLAAFPPSSPASSSSTSAPSPPLEPAPQLPPPQQQQHQQQQPPNPESPRQEEQSHREHEWQSSPLNPLHRIDSLAPLPRPAFRLDAVDATGCRFFAVPRFALDKPPLRVDVYLPAAELWPPRLRDAVRPEQALLLRAGTEVAETPVGRWLVRVLERWVAQQGGLGTVEGLWWGLPYGSSIAVVVGGGEHGGEDVDVHLVAEYGVEQDMLRVEQLRRMWEGEVDAAMWNDIEFGVVDWDEVRFRRQVHEAISVVTVRGRELVFKSLLRQQRDMYHELKMLLALKQHPNVISRPGVCGFLLEWLPLGSLRERLLRDDYDETTLMEQKFRWARQIIEALIHLNNHPAGFYPDLKPDNILLREGDGTELLDAVLIDLEQRGGWFAWSPPEVAYVEYLEILSGSSALPSDLQEEILTQLRQYYGDPEWEPGADSQSRYRNAEGGFSAPWLALLGERRDGGERRDLLERAQVFMLGKLLWCIFEGQPFIRCGIDHEMLRDPHPDYESKRTGKARAFPEFKKTPDELRRLIRACTVGAPEWEANSFSGVLAVQRGKLCPAAPDIEPGNVAAGDTLTVARNFWRREFERARTCMAELLPQSRPPEIQKKHNSLSVLEPGLLDQVRTRPTLSETLGELTRIAELMCAG
ncbi:U-box domain-containing protein 33 [Madurella mycetomatis]|uniref:U-box domain-containing protein 33 n=1 Tax=Madurella mycetomatis TaxID=100816 RepID=A0A175W070_9PEZI|nr:U-box domain-containing protein 33 [Madurella mycetomatis]KXX83245.1 U-box domain-containing protein 33 [Madurella mycetomatis]